MNRTYSASLLTLFFLSIFLFSGCGLKHTPQIKKEADYHAMELALSAKNFNKQIDSCKGSGWIFFHENNALQKYRFAFAALSPNRVRMTLLSMGHLVETIVADGEKVALISHTGRHEPYTYLSDDPSLKSMVYIPIKISQIVTLLTGKIPLIDYDQAFLTSDHDTGQSLTVQKRWSSQKQQLSFNTEKMVASMKQFDSKGNMEYTIQFLTYQAVDQFQIPGKITIQDNTGRNVTFQVTDFKANPSLKESTFRLTGP